MGMCINFLVVLEWNRILGYSPFKAEPKDYTDADVRELDAVTLNRLIK